MRIPRASFAEVPFQEQLMQRCGCHHFPQGATERTRLIPSSGGAWGAVVSPPPRFGVGVLC